jgi:hypothetical protein
MLWFFYHLECLNCDTFPSTFQLFPGSFFFLHIMNDIIFFFMIIVISSSFNFSEITGSLFCLCKF